MSFDSDEKSIDSAQPIECYLFTYHGQHYFYTSAHETQSVSINGEMFVFSTEYIFRGDNLKLGDSGGSVETCTITVARDNPVALLYQGAPPEDDSVIVDVYRVHGQNLGDYIRILSGTVVQVRFSGSNAEMTIMVENILNREIPRGKLSYYCQNCLFDSKCTLTMANYAEIMPLEGIVGLKFYSSNLLARPSGYYTGGLFIMGDSKRAIKLHNGNYVELKYPIPQSSKSTGFTVYPGCDGLFKTCAERFGNTTNFTGIPYKQPYNAFKHPVDKGAYWVDSDVIRRDTDAEISQIQL